MTTNMHTILNRGMRSFKRRWRRFSHRIMGTDPALDIEPALFRGFSNGELRSLAPKIARTRFSQTSDGIEGWLTRRERQTLYAIARWLPGPFLEIGSWVGLSTSAIALGIRDSGRPKEFITFDFDPTIKNFRPYQGGIGFFMPEGSNEPRGVTDVESYEREIKPILESPGGVVGTLNRNLKKLNIDTHVTVGVGDFQQSPERPYRFVFCDAMHDPVEIGLNAQGLRRYLAPGSILACHDVTLFPENESAIKSYIKIGHSFIIDSLFIGEVI